MLQAPFICKVLAPTGYSFTIADTNTVFTLNTQLQDFAGAERTCNVAGGHLAYFSDLEEQVQVETYFQMQGYLLPSFTPSYWIGLNATANTWPNFRWLSYSIPAPAFSSYEHWGRTQENSEPNNAAGNEYCGAASSALAYQSAWGWSDNVCTTHMPFICRTDGGPLAGSARTAT
jgi:hypothetical protein